MLKTRKKWISILLTLAMLVGLMVPLAAPASAATGYSVSPISVKAGQYNQQPTYLTINLDPGSMFQQNNYLYLRLPSSPSGFGMDFQTTDLNNGNGFVPIKVNGNENSVQSATLTPVAGTLVSGDVYREWKLTVTASTYYQANAGQVVLPIQGLQVPGGTTGDITLLLDAPQGSPFTSASVVIGKASSGTVTVASESSPSFGSGGITTANAAVIDIKEDIPGAFAISNSSIKLTLPPGFTWSGTPTFTSKWGNLNVNDSNYVSYSITDNNGRDLKIAIKQLPANPQANFITVQCGISVDESVAKQGDVTVTVGGDSTVTPSSIVVGKYGEFGVTVSAQSVKDITAGTADTEIGELKIEESLANSLTANRTITLTLSGNALWSTDHPYLDSNLTTNYYGNYPFTNWSAVGSDGKTIKINLDNLPSENDASTLVFKNIKVTTAPDFSGDLNVTVGGSAIGQETTLKLANVKPAVTANASSTPDVKIGSQGVKIGDFTITEASAGAIQSQPTYVTLTSGETSDASVSAPAKIILEAPAGVTFTTTPTVAVTAGDLQLDTSSVSTTTTSDGKGQCWIPVKSQSTVASTITVSNIQLTVDRTVPEGPLYLKVKGSAVNQTLSSSDSGKTETAVAFPSNTAAAKAQIGNVVTPAPGESHQNASFTIGSTTYTVNGVQATMDVAAYVKDGRTYLPVRYVAYALGITPENILWDGKTATFISSGRVVQVTPGSAILTINGAPVTMDVVTDVVNGRVMVPFRWVAQAFGAQVNYDDTTQTVSLSM